MKQELKILFYLKKNHVKKNGLCPVMARISIGKSMSQFSLKIDANASLWDTKAGRMTGKSKLTQEINNAINHINLIIHTHYKELSGIHPVIETDDLKNAVQGIASTQENVLDSFTKMNAAISERVGINYTQAAYESYIYAYKALEGFIRKKLKLNDIPLRALTYSHIEDYYNYLRVDRKLSVGTSGSYLIYFRKIVRNAVNRGILLRDPFFGFESEKAEIVHKSLTKAELDKLMLAEPKAREQKKAKDIFIFGVFTDVALMSNMLYVK